MHIAISALLGLAAVLVLAVIGGVSMLVALPVGVLVFFAPRWIGALAASAAPPARRPVHHPRRVR